MSHYMDPIRNRTRRWFTLAGLVAVAAFALVAGRGTAPRDRVGAPTHGAIAPTSHHDVLPSVEATIGIETPSPAPRRDRDMRRARTRATPPATASGAGRVVAIDPETGQPGAPSPEQLSALRAASGSTIESLTAEGLLETRLPNGTVILHLDERFHDYVIARIGRDGRVTYGCVYDHGGPERALRDSTAAPALELE